MHWCSVGISLHLLGIFSLLVLDIGLAGGASESSAKGKEDAQVVLYTSLNLQSVPKLTDPFSKKYPGIRVEVIRNVATGLVPRIMTESKAGKSGDLVFSKAEYLDLLKNQALLQRYKSTEEIMGDGYVSGVWCSVHGIAYNTRMIPANRVPKSYADLLDPRWKGKMVINLTNFMWTHGMLKLYGQDKGLQFLKNLAKQNTRAERASSLTAQLVAAGEFEIGIPLNTNIDWARITDPLFADLQAIGMLSKGRNTTAARLFMDFVLSKEGQQILAETGRTVLRSDIPMSDGINPEKLQIIGPEARIDPDKYQALMVDLFTK